MVKTFPFKREKYTFYYQTINWVELTIQSEKIKFENLLTMIELGMTFRF